MLKRLAGLQMSEIVLQPLGKAAWGWAKCYLHWAATCILFSEKKAQYKSSTAPFHCTGRIFGEHRHRRTWVFTFLFHSDSQSSFHHDHCMLRGSSSLTFFEISWPGCELAKPFPPSCQAVEKGDLCNPKSRHSFCVIYWCCRCFCLCVNSGTNVTNCTCNCL